MILVGAEESQGWGPFEILTQLTAAPGASCHRSVTMVWGVCGKACGVKTG